MLNDHLSPKIAGDENDSFLHARPWIPGDEKPIFTVVIH